MPKLADVLKNYNKSIKNGGGGVKLPKGMTLQRLMQQESEKLRELLNKYIDLYYDSYTPQGDNPYERTYKFKDINNIRIEVNGNSARVYFDSGALTYPSWFNHYGTNDGFVPLLINEGWQWKTKSGERYHLSWYEGFHFVEKAVEEYNRTNIYRIKIVIHKEHKGNAKEEEVS